MSMSYYVEAVVPPTDDKFKAMCAVLDACREAGVTVPQKVWDYFENAEPDKEGLVRPIDIKPENRGDDQTVWEVRIDRLPKDTKIVRFVVSC